MREKVQVFRDGVLIEEYEVEASTPPNQDITEQLRDRWESLTAYEKNELVRKALLRLLAR